MNAPHLQPAEPPVVHSADTAADVHLAPTAVITNAAILAAHVAEAAGDALLSAPLAPLPAAPDEMFATIAGRPEVVVLDAAEDADAALELAAQLDRHSPHVGVVLVTPQSHDVELLRAATRAGVRDVLHPEADTDTIRGVLAHVGQVARTHAATVKSADSTHRAKIYTVNSSKGGAGKSTVATNLAVGLNREAPGRVVIVDLDLQFGDVAAMLRVRYEHTLADAVRAQDPLSLKATLAQHESGLYVLPSPESLTDEVGYEAVGQMLDRLATEFDYIVIDTPAGLDDRTITALDRTTTAVLVVPLAVPAVRGMKRMLSVMDELGVDASRRMLVVNQADAGGGLKLGHVTDFLGQQVDLTLPVSKAALAATNAGTPLLLGGPGKDPLSRALAALVERFAPPKPKKTRWGRGTGRHRK